MNGVTVLIPCKERDGLEQIRWGAEDRHNADDSSPHSAQYSSWWRVGLRDTEEYIEIWQLKASNCRRSTAHFQPLDAYCAITLGVWNPEFLSEKYMDVWKISVQLTSDEIVHDAYVSTTTSNTTIVVNPPQNDYERLLEKTRNIYNQFFDNPYGVMMRVALK